MELEVSLPYSQQYAIGQYPEQDGYISHPHT